MSALPIQVNLIPGYNHVPPVVKLNQYEYGFTRQFEVYYGDNEYPIPSGSQVRIEGTKPDGNGYSYASGVVSFSGNIVTVVIKEQMTVLDGVHEAELVILPSNTLRASTINLKMDIEPGALKSSVPISDTDIPEIIDAARSHELAAAQSEANAAESEANAAASQRSAASSASTASTAANNALVSAATANNAASNASSSAARASVSATEAKTSELAAAGSANSAQIYAQRAETYADLTIPDLHIDLPTMQLIETDNVDRLSFSYSQVTGQLSYTVT